MNEFILVQKPCSRLYSSAQITFDYASTPKLSLFLASVSVPFLNTANNIVPSEIAHVILGCSWYERTRQEDQIDAIFNIKFDGEECFAVIECKNVQEPIKTYKYYDILLKPRKLETNVKLHFLVCTKIEEANAVTMTASLINTCTYYIIRYNLR